MMLAGGVGVTVGQFIGAWYRAVALSLQDRPHKLACWWWSCDVVSLANTLSQWLDQIVVIKKGGHSATTKALPRIDSGQWR